MSVTPDPTLPIFILVMNDMRCNTEQRTIIAWAHSADTLVALCQREKVPRYVDGGPDLFGGSKPKKYSKCYRKGGPLEWYNDLDEPGFNNGQDGGILRQISLSEAMDQYLRWLGGREKFLP